MKDKQDEEEEYEEDYQEVKKTMGEKIKINGKPVKIVRDKGYLYYTKGDPISIYKTKMQHRGRTKSKQ